MIGILLTNTGTPDAPTTTAVRRYLREFLSDKRIVKLPRVIWLPILYGIILPFRSPKSAALYQHIWTPKGSPMRVLMEELRFTLDASLNTNNSNKYCVEIGMNYGSPSIASALKKLQQRGAEKIIALPLFPQYSDTSSGSSLDRINQAANEAHINLHIIKHYYTYPAYIAALAESVTAHWQQQGRSSHLLISFHGIPKRYATAGDPYPEQCEKTALLLAKALNLSQDQWTLCYQSQFGYDKWLTPSTQQLLTALPQQGIKTLDIICPGFAVDCLETLEEIAKTGKATFIKMGGEALNYIPALNTTTPHIKALEQIATG